MHVCLNGRLIPYDRATVSVNDRGFVYGDGIFETLRAYGGRPFHLREHWRRLLHHARKLRLAVPFTYGGLEKTVGRLLRMNRLSDATIKIVLSRGVGRGTAFQGAWKPTWVVWVRPLELPPPELYRKGIAVRIPAWRQNARGLVSHLKTLNYLERVFTREMLRARGTYEAIFLITDGDVAEGTYSNVFGVRGGRVFTPDLHASVLPGVTRQIVLRLCRREGIPVAERRVTPDDLRRADELFITNSLIEVLPVTSLDGRKIGIGRPGPSTRLLADAYRREAAGSSGRG